MDFDKTVQNTWKTTAYQTRCQNSRFP